MRTDQASAPFASLHDVDRRRLGSDDAHYLAFP